MVEMACHRISEASGPIQARFTQAARHATGIISRLKAQEEASAIVTTQPHRGLSMSIVEQAVKIARMKQASASSGPDDRSDELPDRRLLHVAVFQRPRDRHLVGRTGP